MTTTTAPELRFVVDGPPVPKQRARRGKGGRHYTPARTRSYESRVRWLAVAAVAKARWTRRPGALYAVELLVVFPDERRRDVDNVAKAVLDACNGVVWIDDAMVTDLRVRRAIDRVAPRVEMAVRRVLAKEDA